MNEEVEKLIISGLDKVKNSIRAVTRSAAIAQNYANVKDVVANRVTVHWEADSEAVAWSDPRKKLTYSFDE